MSIAALAILNFNIYSSIESEYRNIGVIKAVGLKNSSFNAVYLLSYLAALIVSRIKIRAPLLQVLISALVMVAIF
jgi:putative ABC transport system permease protein